MGIFVSDLKEIQNFNNLGCNRIGNQIASLDLGVMKTNYFSINRPKPIKMIWDSMITRLFFLKERLCLVSSVDFDAGEDPSTMYFTNILVYCSLCSLGHICIYIYAHLVIYMQ